MLSVKNYNKKKIKKKTRKEQNNTVNNIKSNIRINRKKQQQTTKQEKGIGKKSNCIDIQVTNSRDCTRKKSGHTRVKEISKEQLDLLIAIQNDVIRNNYLKVTSDYTQQNCKWRLCGDSDETNTVNYRRSTRPGMTGWESDQMVIAKELSFDHSTIWY